MLLDVLHISVADKLHHGTVHIEKLSSFCEKYGIVIANSVGGRGSIHLWVGMKMENG